MGDLSKNFNRDEFECECGCGFDTVDAGLLRVLQGVADYYKTIYANAKIEITSGCRCPEHDEEVQREHNPNYIANSSKSKHRVGKAADFKVYVKTDGDFVQLPSEIVYNYIDDKYPDTLGLGMYTNRNHVDSREGKGRW